LTVISFSLRGNGAVEVCNLFAPLREKVAGFFHDRKLFECRMAWPSAATSPFGHCLVARAFLDGASTPALRRLIGARGRTGGQTAQRGCPPTRCARPGLYW
jgi:hypothetical protein